MAKKRAGYHHGDLRQAILRETLALLEERSGPHFTMREVAERIGVSHSASYRHFKDKGALLVALSIDGFQRLDEFQRKNLPPKSSALARVRRLGTGYIAFARTYPWHFRLMFSINLNGSEDYEALLKVGAEGFEPVRLAVAEAQANKDLRAGNSYAMAVQLWAAVHGLAMLIIDNQLDFSKEAESISVKALIESHVDMLLRGMAP